MDTKASVLKYEGALVAAGAGFQELASVCGTEVVKEGVVRLLKAIDSELWECRVVLVKFDK